MTFHGTTIVTVRRDGRVALGGDGQVSIGETVMKARSTKVRALKGGKVLAGFAGSVADALTLYEKFEEKLDRYPANLPRAAVELAKDWRSDRILRRLDCLLYTSDAADDMQCVDLGGRRIIKKIFFFKQKTAYEMS